jgi:hypothetical protein
LPRERDEVQKWTLKDGHLTYKKNAATWERTQDGFFTHDTGTTVYPCENKNVHPTSQHTQKLSPDRLKIKM